MCRADMNVCAEIRGQIKQQLVACITGSLKPRPVVVAAGSSAEDAAMLREATVGILVLHRHPQRATAPATTGTASVGASTAAAFTPRDSEGRLSTFRQHNRSFFDSARSAYNSLLPLLHDPAGERGRSLPIPGSPPNSLAPKRPRLSLELGLYGPPTQGPPSPQLQPSDQQPQPLRSGERDTDRTGRVPITGNGVFEPYLQAACLCGRSTDVVLASFEALCPLIFKNALSEQAQSLLLLDQVVYSTSLLSTFLFAMLLTNLLDPSDPTASVTCIWFSLIAAIVACIIGGPMAVALDDEVRAEVPTGVAAAGSVTPDESCKQMPPAGTPCSLRRKILVDVRDSLGTPLHCLVIVSSSVVSLFLQRSQSLCYAWLRRRKILSLSRCLWTMLEGIVTSLAIFALVYQAVFSGIRMGALLHLTDFFLVALCVGIVVRPWFIALGIGGRIARGRVTNRALKGLQDIVYRRAAVSSQPDGQCSNCGCPPETVPPLLLRTAPAAGGSTGGLSRQTSRRTLHQVASRSAVRRPSRSRSETAAQHLQHTHLPPRAQDTVASPYSSCEGFPMSGLAASLRSVAVNTEAQHGAAAGTASQRGVERPHPLLLRCKARVGAVLGLFVLLLPILALATLPWLIILMQLLLLHGEASVLRHLHLLPYAFPAWWLALLPCVAVVVLLAALFRQCNTLLGPEQVLRAADNVCAAALAAAALEDAAESRLQNQAGQRQQRRCSFICLTDGKRTRMGNTARICELCWALDAFDVLTLRELESSTGLYGAQGSQIERQRLELLRLSNNSAFAQTNFITRMTPCCRHRLHHTLLLQRIATLLPASSHFSLRNDEAVRHALSVHPTGKALIRSSKALTVGKAGLPLASSLAVGKRPLCRRGFF